jgi:hypothetical protein
MKAGWFILWAVVVWQVAVWAFAPPPKPVQAVASRAVPIDVVEKSLTEARGTQRREALAALDKPWSDRCGQNRKDFLSGVNEYFYHRQNQSERYPEKFGKAGADYIAGQWSTTDDARIERLTQEAYAQGYVKPTDFDGVARKTVAAVVKNERIIGTGCGS